MRRTSVVVMISPTATQTVRLCEPVCRDEFLLDLGLVGHGGGAAFRGRGRALVHVGWNTTDYQVSWARRSPSARACDLCGHEWQARPARIRPRREPTAAQLAALAAHQFTPKLPAPTAEGSTTRAATPAARP